MDIMAILCLWGYSMFVGLFYVCGVNKTSSELSLTKTKINEYINEILNTEQ